MTPQQVTDIWDKLVERCLTVPHGWSKISFALDSVEHVAVFTATCQGRRCIHQVFSHDFTDDLSSLEVQARLENALLTLENKHQVEGMH